MSNLSDFVSRVSLAVTGNTSGTLSTVGNGTFVLAGGPNVTLSQDGRTVTISASAGAGGGNLTISAGTSSLSSGTLSFANSNGLSFGLNNGTLTGSIPGNGGITLGGNSTSAGAGFALISTGTMTMAGGNNITLSQNGNAVTISGPTTVAQSNQTLGVYGSSQTTGQSSSSTHDARSLSLVGAGQVSVGWSNSSLIISATTAAQTAESNTFGISNLGNTAGTSGTIASNQARLLFAGGNNITLSQSTNGGSATITISGPNTAAQTAESNTFGISNLGNTAGTSGTIASNQARLLFAGGNNITLSQSTNGGSATITVSAANQTNQDITIFARGQTTLSSSEVVNASSWNFNAQGLLRVGVSNDSVLYSAPNGVTITGNTAANSTGTWGSDGYTINASTNITAWMSNGSLVLSGPNAGAGAGFSGGLSNIGNTSGDTGVTGTRLVFAGGNNVTLSGATDANGGTITVSAFNQTVESQSIGASNLGNTLGTSGVASGGQVRAVIIGTSNITVSQSVNGASATLSLIGQPSFSAGVSNLGGTSGATGVTGTRLVFAGTDGISLTQTTDANGGTITIDGNAATYSNYYRDELPGSPGTVLNASLLFRPIHVPSYASATAIHMMGSMSVSSSSNSSHGGTITAAVGIYSRSGSTLSLATSGSMSVAWTNTSNNSLASLSGDRILSMAANINMTPGEWWLGVLVRTSTVNANWFTLSMYGPQPGFGRAGVIGAVVDSTYLNPMGLGAYSASQTGVIASAALSDIRRVTNNMRNPFVYFPNYTT